MGLEGSEGTRRNGGGATLTNLNIAADVQARHPRMKADWASEALPLLHMYPSSSSSVKRNDIVSGR